MIFPSVVVTLFESRTSLNSNLEYLKQELADATGEFEAFATNVGSSKAVARLVGGHDCVLWLYNSLLSKGVLV